MGSPVSVGTGQPTGCDHSSELLHRVCGICDPTAPSEIHIFLSFSVEYNHEIAVRKTAAFIVDEPRVALNSREHKASTRQ